MLVKKFILILFLKILRDGFFYNESDRLCISGADSCLSIIKIEFCSTIIFIQMAKFGLFLQFTCMEISCNHTKSVIDLF
jgi:hypothetical protein